MFDDKINISVNFILRPLFQSAQQFYGKREGSGSELVTNGSECGSGRPKSIRIRNTILQTVDGYGTYLFF
jgi:hypothetical protein